jgi:hypothetical protein
VTTYDRVLARLDGVRLRSGPQEAQALCPAHDDHNPSLSVTAVPGWGVLVCCHAGCRTEDVLTAIGLSMADLYDKPKKSSYDSRRNAAMMRPPATDAVALLPSPKRWGMVYVDMLTRCRDIECQAIYAVLTVAGPNGMHVSDDQLAVIHRTTPKRVRSHLWHLVADGLVRRQGGGKGRGNRSTYTVRYPEPPDMTTAPPTWAVRSPVQEKGSERPLLVAEKGSERPREKARSDPFSHDETVSDLHKHKPAPSTLGRGDGPRVPYDVAAPCQEWLGERGGTCSELTKLRGSNGKPYCQPHLAAREGAA